MSDERAFDPTTEIFPRCPSGFKAHDLNRIGQRSYNLPFSDDQNLIVCVIFCAECGRTLSTSIVAAIEKGSAVKSASSLPVDPRITADLLKRMRS